jgi:hypothetical protein
MLESNQRRNDLDVVAKRLLEIAVIDHASDLFGKTGIVLRKDLEALLAACECANHRRDELAGRAIALGKTAKELSLITVVPLQTIQIPLGVDDIGSAGTARVHLPCSKVKCG